MDLRFLEGGWKESESWIQDRTDGQDPPDGLWKDMSGVTDDRGAPWSTRLGLMGEQPRWEIDLGVPLGTRWEIDLGVPLGTPWDTEEMPGT